MCGSRRDVTTRPSRCWPARAPSTEGTRRCSSVLDASPSPSRDFAQAVTLLEEALTLAPDATVVHYPLALAYRGLGNPAKADEHLRLRGEVEPTPADPLLEALGGLHRHGLGPRDPRVPGAR